MKIIDKLLSPVKAGEKKRGILGIVFGSLFLISLLFILVFVLDNNIFSSAAVTAVLGFVIFRYKISALPFGSPPVIHLMCICLGLYAAIMLPSGSGGAGKILTPVTAFVVFFGLTEFFFGLLGSWFGGKPSTGLLARTLLICLPLYFTVFIFLPSESFFTNCAELHYVYLDFIPHYLLKTLIYTLLTALVLCSFGKSFVRFCWDIITGLLLCVYTQYIFMNKVLPTSMADAVDWGGMKGKMAVNCLVWLLLLSLPTAADILICGGKTVDKAFKKPIARIALPAFIGGMQLLTLPVLILSHTSALNEYNMERLSGKEQFMVSPDKNIITLIVDMADQKYFEEAYEQDPEAFECLKDFTYYSNASMVYDSTNLSIPSTLTAARTYPETSLESWYSEITKDEPACEFYKRLHDNGYCVGLFGDFMDDYGSLDGLADNVVHASGDDLIINKGELYDKIDRMSAYRYFPLALKQFTSPPVRLGNEAVWWKDSVITNNTEFYENTDLTLREDGKNAFVMEHISGYHFTAVKKTSDDKTGECLRAIDRYISQLKDLGVYDDALIIVMADHGQHYQPDNMPIFYLKPPHQTADSISVSTAPVSLTDYAATCLDEMGMSDSSDDDLFGRPVSRIPEDEQRERLVFQRFEFEYTGKVNWKRYSDASHEGALFGYYFTGTKKDLAEHEKSDPPDVVLETDGYGH